MIAPYPFEAAAVQTTMRDTRELVNLYFPFWLFTASPRTSLKFSAFFPGRSAGLRSRSLNSASTLVAEQCPERSGYRCWHNVLISASQRLRCLAGAEAIPSADLLPQSGRLGRGWGIRGGGLTGAYTGAASPATWVESWPRAVRGTCSIPHAVEAFDASGVVDDLGDRLECVGREACRMGCQFANSRVTQRGGQLELGIDTRGQVLVEKVHNRHAEKGAQAVQVLQRRVDTDAGSQLLQVARRGLATWATAMRRRASSSPSRAIFAGSVSCTATRVARSRHVLPWAAARAVRASS